jgi:hypothetical protein
MMWTNFSIALEALKTGKIIQRQCWKESDMSVHMIQLKSDVKDMGFTPMFMVKIRTVNEQPPYISAPWIPSVVELLANDWDIISPKAN